MFAEPLRPTHAIVLEDDLDLSPDFLSFLLAFATSTSTDPGVGPAAISGWNDNGAARGVADAKGTMLTGFFPGLGWLLSREVWDEIAPLWPCHCRREGIKGGVGGRRRKFPAAAAAPAGWDWWLRGEFHARGWYTLYPSLGRVAHRGGQGTNVAPAQQKAVFKDARVADGSNALGPDEWAAERVSARVTEGAYRAWLDAHDREARSVSISDIHGGYLTGGLRGRIGMHPPTEEAIFRVTFADDGFRKIASRLALWPHPRGFFEGRLLLPLKGGASLLLVREDASVGRRRSALKSGFLADRNQSCADACGKRGGVCVPRAVAALNDCGALARAFGCRGGCVFETGVDIPAVVVADAPIETKSACVVTEDAGAIGCRGEFAHTRRACVCGRREGAGAYMAVGGRGPSRGRARPSGAGRGGPSRRPPRRARGGRLNGRKKDEL